MRRGAKAGIYFEESAKPAQRNAGRLAIAVLTIEYPSAQRNHCIPGSAKCDAPAIARMTVSLTTFERRYNHRIDQYFRHRENPGTLGR